MANPDSTTPRVFLARHGQTEWSKLGRWTGKTDLPLTAAGERQVVSSARTLVGYRKLVDTDKLARIYVSPRLRAQRTSVLMLGDATNERFTQAGKMTTTEDLAEWDYGDYEGLLTKEIRQLREERGLDGKGWDHFRDGCEGGETSDQVTQRVDHLIKEIRDLQRPNMHGEEPCDVLLVAHGHILRGFARRWLGYPMEFPLGAMLEPGSIAVLSYQHHSMNEPAFLLGIALPEDGEN